MKLSIFIVLCCALLSVTGVPQLGALLWYGKSGNTAVSIHRLAWKAVTWLTPCTEDKTPNQMTFRDASECVNRCPGHCAGLANCNATCVMENRCICGASQYCLINRDIVNPDGSLGMDCFDLNNPVLSGTGK